MLALAARVDVVTAEIEHINTAGLAQVEANSAAALAASATSGSGGDAGHVCDVQPPAATIRCIQVRHRASIDFLASLPAWGSVISTIHLLTL